MSDFYTHADEEYKIDLMPVLRGILKQIARSWWVFGLILLLCAGAGMFQARRVYSPRYRAKASFVVSVSDSSSISVSQYYNRVTTSQLTATFPYILTSGALSKVVAADLGVASVPGTIKAETLGDTNIFQISVTASDPQMAYDILESVIENYPSVAKYVIGSTSLKLLENSGVPTTPINSIQYTNYIPRYMTIGACVYLLLLIFLVLSRRTILSKSDLHKYLNAKYLGGVPLVRFKQRSREKKQDILLVNPSLGDAFRESMDDLQIRLADKMTKKGWKSVLFTSALTGEGKTTNACNLALSLAATGAKVILVDADLRNPSVARRLDREAWQESGGLIDYLTGKLPYTSLLHSYEGTSLVVLPGGTPESRTAALYTNGRLEKLIARLSREADYVLVDAPPCTFMNDTALIATSVDAGIMLIRQDFAPVNRIVSGLEILAQADLPLVGCILNGVQAGMGHYGYGYGYGYSRYGYGRYGYGHYATKEKRRKR